MESHVRNLFHKLDVSSRVEIARLLERAVESRPSGGGSLAQADRTGATP